MKKCLMVLWARAHSRWTEANSVENSFVVWLIKNLRLFLKTIFSELRRRGTNAHQCTAKMPASVMVWGSISGHDVRKRHRYCCMQRRGFRVAYAVMQHNNATMWFSGQIYGCFSKTMPTHIVHILWPHGSVIWVQTCQPIKSLRKSI